MVKSISFFLFSFFCSFTIHSQDITAITIDNAISYLGKEATICALVTDTNKPAGDNKNMYINFGGKYPDHSFTVVIFPADQHNFKYDPMMELKDKNICVSGKIKQFKDKPQIVVKYPTQINIQNE